MNDPQRRGGGPARRRPGSTSSSFDRIAPPGPTRAARHRGRDRQGKEALYSTSPVAAPSRPVDARCRRCGARLSLTVGDLARLLVPPFVVDPFRRRLCSRCPACDHYAWLELRTGQALQVLLERRQGRG
ncbi:MAG: hypothetical protein ACLFRD_08220 [Nitriliruptoraceae bacterium]